MNLAKTRKNKRKLPIRKSLNAIGIPIMNENEQDWENYIELIKSDTLVSKRELYYPKLQGCLTPKKKEKIVG